jgi:hypothetical protein
VTGLVKETGASLVVLSAATTEAAQRAAGEADEITSSEAGLRVLAGRPGDSLGQLRQQARATLARSAEG